MIVDNKHENDWLTVNLIKMLTVNTKMIVLKIKGNQNRLHTTSDQKMFMFKHKTTTKK